MNTATDISETSTNLAQSIAALPPLPATAQQILTCFGDEFIDAEKVAAVVDGDPGICAKLLGLANSAYFGLAEPVHTISEAISRVLGVDTVRSLVLAMAIQNSFNSRGCPAFNTERFWMQSLLAAECCKTIAAADQKAEDAVRDLAYSAGLCHNLGLMALAHLEPQRTSAVLQQHGEQNEGDTLKALLRSDMDTDHKAMTAELARFWQLPEPMVDAYQYLASPQAQCKERLGIVVAAGVAAVENTEVEDDKKSSLGKWSELLEIDADSLQGMAELGSRQKERVQSLAGNMAR